MHGGSAGARAPEDSGVIFCRLTKKEAWVLCWSCRLLDVAKLGKATAEFKNATPFLKGAFTTLKNIVGAPSQRH